jgi:hypothetical protein
MCEKCPEIDKNFMSQFQIAGVRLGAQHPAPGVNVIRRKSLARAGLLISLNTTHGDRLHYGFVIAELPHKEAATLTMEPSDSRIRRLFREVAQDAARRWLARRAA